MELHDLAFKIKFRLNEPKNNEYKTTKKLHTSDKVGFGFKLYIFLIK